MRFSLALAVSAIAGLAAAGPVARQAAPQGRTIQVDVGLNNTFAFSPPTVNAAVGDTIVFVFHPKNHTVTQSSFAAPCTPLDSGLNTGFQPVNATNTTLPSLSLPIKDTSKPMWFFCAQTTNTTSHCERGMVFSVNPTITNASTTQDAFAAKAFALGGVANGTGSSAAPSGASSTSSSSGTATGTTSSPTPSKSNAAGVLTRNAAGVLAAAGLALGIVL